MTDIINRIRETSAESPVENGFFFYRDDSIRDGLAGLIANRIAEDIKKPVIIMSGPGPDGFIKGSGRSYGKFNFLRHVEEFSESFERLGGHAQAFGFTISGENITPVMNNILISIGRDPGSDEALRIDMILNTGSIDAALIEKFSLLEPYGKDNEMPVFLSRCVKVNSYQNFGAESSHGKYILPGNLQAIGWNMAEVMNEYYESGKNLDLVYRLENNTYQNRVYPRLVLIDLDYSG